MMIIDRLESPEEKDDEWHNDPLISEKNLLHVLMPYTVGKEEWIVLSCRINYYDDKDPESWRDTYNIFGCTQNSVTLKGIGDRHLTIELDEYTGNLNYYECIEDSPGLCKKLKSIASSTISQEISITTG